MLLRNLPILPKFWAAELQFRKAPKIGNQNKIQISKTFVKFEKKPRQIIVASIKLYIEEIERSTIQNLRIKILATWLFWLTFEKTMTAKSVSREMKLKLQTSPINLYCHLISGSTKNSKYILFIIVLLIVTYTQWKWQYDSLEFLEKTCQINSKIEVSMPFM